MWNGAAKSLPTMIKGRRVLKWSRSASATIDRKEYREYHAKPEQKKRRAARNAARRKMVKAGLASKGDGRDVHHKNRNPTDNSRGNLSVVGRKKNRGWRKGKRG